MVLDFRSDMFDHAQKLSLAFHDTESKGILMYRINNQAAAMGQIVVALPARGAGPADDRRHGLHLGQDQPAARAARARHHSVRRLLDDLSTPTASSRASTACAGLGAINLAIVYEAMAMMRVVLAFGTQRREYTRFRKQGESSSTRPSA